MPFLVLLPLKQADTVAFFYESCRGKAGLYEALVFQQPST